VGASLHEVELPLEQYPTFSEFFARRLVAGARAVERRRGAVVSPCDGTVLASGTTSGDQLLQAKGRSYSLRALLGDDALARELAGGTYLTVYLSPRDFHRVHAPVSGLLRSYRHIPGRLFPVSGPFVETVDGLFTRNERVVFHLEVGGPADDVPGARGGARSMAVVMVGAAGVGNIVVSHDGRESRGLRRERTPQSTCFTPPVPVAQGEELGAFHLGSTVIVLLPPGMADPWRVTEGQKVRFGELVAEQVRTG
jgi:phosphatidylserine decarboxylase